MAQDQPLSHATTSETPAAAPAGDARSDPRRRQVLEAARRLFEEKGFEATTMAELARHVGIAVGTLYKFFKDKRALYQTLVADTVRDFEVELCRALDDPELDLVGKIDAFLRIGTELFEKHLPLIRVYFAETEAAFLFTPAGLEDEALRSHQRILDALTRTMRRGVEQGILIDLDPAALALALEGMHNGFLTTMVRFPGMFTPEQICTYTHRVFFESALRN